MTQTTKATKRTHEPSPDEAAALLKWGRTIWAAGLTIPQTQQKIRGMHALLVASWDLIEALIDQQATKERR